MPELPEVETIRKGLQKTVVGKRIKSVEVRLGKIISLGPRTVSNQRRTNQKKLIEFQRTIQGQKILKAERRAKMLILDLSGPYSLLIHLKMTGQLIFAKKGEHKKVKIFNTPNSTQEFLPHKYTHVIFDFTNGDRLYYNDLRQFGYMRLVKDSEVVAVKELSEYGPEPLRAEFTLQYLINRGVRRPKLSIKQFLMDPKVVAGIGNIYSDEILYWSKIRPERALISLNRKDWQAIFRNIPFILRRALAAHGSSVGDFFRIDGSEGQFGREHMVYGRYGEKCKKCASIVKSAKLGGRTSSFCPKCQR